MFTSSKLLLGVANLYGVDAAHLCVDAPTFSRASEFAPVDRDSVNGLRYRQRVEMPTGRNSLPRWLTRPKASGVPHDTMRSFEPRTGTLHQMLARYGCCRPKAAASSPKRIGTSWPKSGLSQNDRQTSEIGVNTHPSTSYRTCAGGMRGAPTSMSAAYRRAADQSPFRDAPTQASSRRARTGQLQLMPL